MAGLSRYAAQALFDRTLNPSTRLVPAYLALHKGVVHDETYGNEATYTTYARQLLTGLYVSGGAPVDGDVVLTVSNSIQVTFPTSTGPLNLITHWAIWDSLIIGTGNVQYSGALTVPKTVDTGDVLIIRVGELAISLT